MNITYDNTTSGKCTVSPSTISGSTISVDDTFTITANSGYKFDGVSGEYNTTSPQIRITSNRTTNNYVYFSRSISADNKTITITCIKETVFDQFLCTIANDRPILIDTPINPTLTLTKNLTNVTIT